MQQWEYFRETGPVVGLPWLNSMGRDGWELAGVSQDPKTGDFTLIFKRPLAVES